mgnify:CR=1 FL=1
MRETQHVINAADDSRENRQTTTTIQPKHSAALTKEEQTAEVIGRTLADRFHEEHPSGE